jgi:ribonuclease R
MIGAVRAQSFAAGAYNAFDMKLSLEDRVIAALGNPDYVPLKAKALARRLKIRTDGYEDFRQTLKLLYSRGKIELDKGRCLRLKTARDGLVGVYKSIRAGGGYVRMRGTRDNDVFIRSLSTLDAATGDTVKVQVLKPARGERSAEGKIVEIVSRGAGQFVGTYEVKHGEGRVRIDGGAFFEAIYVSDAQTKNARPGDKVVVEILRYPSPRHFGEAVVIEVLGKAGLADVDLLGVIRQFELPDSFSPESLAEARVQAKDRPTDST